LTTVISPSLFDFRNETAAIPKRKKSVSCIQEVAKSENLIMDAINCDGLASAVTTEGKGRRASENGERFSVLFSLFLFFLHRNFGENGATFPEPRLSCMCVHTIDGATRSAADDDKSPKDLKYSHGHGTIAYIPGRLARAPFPMNQ
jgi:hypothetical protein